MLNRRTAYVSSVDYVLYFSSPTPLRVLDCSVYYTIYFIFIRYILNLKKLTWIFF